MQLRVRWLEGILSMGCFALGCGHAENGVPLSDEAPMESGGAAPTSSVVNAPVTTPDPTSPAPTNPASMPTQAPVLPAQTCVAPAVVCEDFEEGAIHTAVWGIKAPNATLEVVQDRVAHGKFAMHTHTLASAGSYAELTTDKFLGPNLYGRMYMYFAVNPRNVHGFMFEGLGNIQGGAAWMSLSESSRYFYINYFKDNPAKEYSSPSLGRLPVPVGKWFCLEWNLRPLEGVNNSVWIDGVQFAKDDTIMFKMPGFTEIRVGWTHFAHDDPDPFTDIWYDDIAFGPERIGCN